MNKLLLGSLASLLVASCSNGGADEAPVSGQRPGAPLVAASTPAGAENVSVETQAVATAGAGEDAAVRPKIDLTAHVPNHAVAYFECASIDALEEALLRFETMTGQAMAITGGAGLAGATLPLVESGIDPARVDRLAPVAVALVPVVGGAKPKAMVIVPAIGEQPVFSSVAALSMRGMRAMRVPGNYVVVSHVETAPSSGSGSAEVTRDLPGGFLRGRFQMDVVAPIISPSLFGIAKAMNESYRLSRPRQSAGDLYEFDGKRVLDALGGAEQLAFGIDLRGDSATVETRLVRSMDQAVNHPAMPAELADLAHQRIRSPKGHFVFRGGEWGRPAGRVGGVERV